MCCTRAARWKFRTQKLRKNRHLCTIAELCRAIPSQLRHISTIGKKLAKQQYLSHVSPLRPNSGWDRFGSFGYPSKFQRVSRLGSVTLRHSSSGRQPNCGVEQRAPHVFGRTAITHILVMVALCNRADHYIFILFLLLSSFFFFSSPNLSSRILDVYHTSAHGVVLV